MDITRNEKSYFDSHPAVDKFLFTSDGMGFFTVDAQHAQAHAGNLKRNKKSDTVTTLDRADVNAWWKTEAPAWLERANGAAATAQENYEAAVAAQSGLPKNATPANKGAANKAVKIAKGILDAATEDATNAQAAVDGLNAESDLKAAEAKLEADAAAAGTTDATIAADKTAVDAAAKRVKKK